MSHFTMNNDCLFCIFRLLNLNDILSSAQVCKQFNVVTNNELIWKAFFCNKSTIDKIDYKKKYKDYTILDNFLLKNFDCPLFDLQHKKKTKIKIITKLRDLELSCCQLASIPSEIGLLIQLKYLDLGFNNLREIPREIGLLTRLCTLELNNNKLQSIPIEIGLLTQLRYLYLYNNELQIIPKEIGSLVNLEYLHLYGNKFESIPDEINLLPKLRDSPHYIPYWNSIN
jgi:Leucine-rich repeat (LRR) protein